MKAAVRKISYANMLMAGSGRGGGKGNGAGGGRGAVARLLSSLAWAAWGRAVMEQSNPQRRGDAAGWILI